MKILSLLLAIVLAGCLGGASGPAETSSTGLANDVTDETGALKVRVMDSEQRPVADARVALPALERAADTDAEGVVTFGDLAPEKYTVVVAKPGFQAAQPQGTVIAVEAGVVTELRLRLDPVPIVSDETSYHRTLIFRGFISCSAEWMRVATLINRTQCGKGVNVGTTTVGKDPSENASHAWAIENNQIQTVLAEATWKQSGAGTGAQLYFSTHTSFTCTSTSCQYGNELAGKGGGSPFRLVVEEGIAHNITKVLGGSTAVYPKPVWSAARTHCGGGCPAAATFQQSYDLLMSAWYGSPAPPGWSAYS